MLETLTLYSPHALQAVTRDRDLKTMSPDQAEMSLGSTLTGHRAKEVRVVFGSLEEMIGYIVDTPIAKSGLVIARQRLVQPGGKFTIQIGV